MEGFSPVDIADVLGGEWIHGVPPSPLCSFSIDTRSIVPGDTFVALQGGIRDGHEFLEAAHTAGARSALVTTPDPCVLLPQLKVADTLSALQTLAQIRRRQFRGPVIGITGSYGKTTVKEFMGCLLGDSWLRTYGNLNNHIGLPLTLLKLDGAMHTGAVIEAGINAPGEMKHLAGIMAPDLVIITGIGPAHLEKLGSVAGIAAEKACLPEAVPAGGVIVMPADCMKYEALRRFADSHRLHLVAAVGEKTESHLPAASNVFFHNYSWTQGASPCACGELRLGISAEAKPLFFRNESPGVIRSLAIAVVAAQLQGVDFGDLDARLKKWQPVARRGEIRVNGALQYFVDCYNSNPDSLVDSVKRFRAQFPSRPSVYVIGGMNELGEHSAALHRLTAMRIKLPQDSHVFVIGPHMEAFVEGLRGGGYVGAATIVSDVDEVREYLQGFHGAVFLKGSRSYALEQLVEEGNPVC